MCSTTVIDFLTTRAVVLNAFFSQANHHVVLNVIADEGLQAETSFTDVVSIITLCQMLTGRTT